jgi:hypothetical protein
VVQGSSSAAGEPADPISGQAWPFVGELQLVLTDDRTFPRIDRVAPRRHLPITHVKIH